MKSPWKSKIILVLVPDISLLGSCKVYPSTPEHTNSFHSYIGRVILRLFYLSNLYSGVLLHALRSLLSYRSLNVEYWIFSIWLPLAFLSLFLFNHNAVSLMLLGLVCLIFPPFSSWIFVFILFIKFEKP